MILKDADLVGVKSMESLPVSSWNGNTDVATEFIVEFKLGDRDACRYVVPVRQITTSIYVVR